MLSDSFSSLLDNALLVTYYNRLKEHRKENKEKVDGKEAKDGVENYLLKNAMVDNSVFGQEHGIDLDVDDEFADELVNFLGLREQYEAEKEKEKSRQDDRKDGDQRDTERKRFESVKGCDYYYHILFEFCVCCS